MWRLCVGGALLACSRLGLCWGTAGVCVFTPCFLSSALLEGKFISWPWQHGFLLPEIPSSGCVNAWA